MNVDRCTEPVSIQRASPESLEMFSCFQALLEVWKDCFLAVTKRGFICMVPSSITQKGDFVAVFDGKEIPSLLRRVAKTNNFQLVSFCYVHGIMHGETAGLDAWMTIALV